MVVDANANLPRPWGTVPAPNAGGAAGTTHGAAGHGAPPGVPRTFGGGRHRAGGIGRDDPPGGASATAELQARRGAGAAPEGARGSVAVEGNRVDRPATAARGERPGRRRRRD